MRREPALAGTGENRFTQGGTAFALGYYLSLRLSFDLLNA
jgi:hypothetical protein